MKIKSILLVIFILLQLNINAQTLAGQRIARLHKGINISSWLVSVQNPNSERLSYYSNEDFILIANLGFDHVRIPVGFIYWIDSNDINSIINEKIFKYLDTTLAYARNNNLISIIDFHPQNGHDEFVLNSNNLNHDALRLAMMWKQIAMRYKDYPDDSVFYEVYNEPGFVTDAEWNRVVKQTLDSIRTTDKNKTIIFQGTENIDLDYIADTNIVVTFHYYFPSLFTHQGAMWTANPHYTTGVPFPYRKNDMPLLAAGDSNTSNQADYVKYPMTGTPDSVLGLIRYYHQLSLLKSAPLYCGEFGVSNMAPVADKLSWIKTVREELEKTGIPWAFWSWKGSDGQASFQMFHCYKCIDTNKLVSDSTGYNVGHALGLNIHSSGIHEPSTGFEIKIFPNPATDYLVIETGPDEEIELSVTDMNGKIYLIKNVFFETKLNIQNWPAGIYLLKIQKNSSFYISKIIIKLP